MATPIVRNPEYETVARTIRRMNRDLVTRYGAHHIGLSKKTIKGERRPETCITFYVLRKTDEVPEQVPSYIDLIYKNGARAGCVATDVCEIKEKPVLLGVRGGNKIVASDNERGTVGLVVRQNGEDLLLTNAHVVTDPGRNQPGDATVTTKNGETVSGRVDRMTDLTPTRIDCDAAVIVLPPDSIDDRKFETLSLRLMASSDLVDNDPRRLFFISDNFTYEARWSGRIPETAEVTIDGQPKLYEDFHQLAVKEGKLAHGNSGAVVFCRSGHGLAAVGLLFGAALAINEAWVFPIGRCLKRMDIVL